jgi:hypothetical protein
MRWKLTGSHPDIRDKDGKPKESDLGTFSGKGLEGRAKAETAQNADAAKNMREGNAVPDYKITPVADNDN